MKKTAAIKYARSKVSEPYRFGDGWKYSYYDSSVDAWRESNPTSYFQMITHRSQTLLDFACEAMDIHPINFEGRGKWADKLP